MGIWGCGLYQDDVTCDVKDDYLNWLRVGKTNEEATELMLEYYEDYIMPLREFLKKNPERKKKIFEV